MTGPELTHRGAYGLAFDERDFPARYLVDAPTTWPAWRTRWQEFEPAGIGTGSPEPEPEAWSPDEARLTVKPQGYAIIDRVAAMTTLHTPVRPSGDALLHPYLASTAIVAANWMGRAPFHCAAFHFDARAWGVLGDRENGKSSTMMWLHQSGIPVLTDDVLVIDGSMALAGPRCLDLRASTAAHFGAGVNLGVVGTRERWRVMLPPVPASVPFAGWVVLKWSDEIGLEPMTLRDRLAALASHRALTAPEADMTGLLDLLEYPMFAFARPPDLARMDEAMQLLLSHLSTHGSG